MYIHSQQKKSYCIIEVTLGPLGLTPYFWSQFWSLGSPFLKYCWRSPDLNIFDRSCGWYTFPVFFLPECDVDDIKNDALLVKFQLLL